MPTTLTTSEILAALYAPDPEPLLERADTLRLKTKGNGIFLRGLIEVSSICARHCLYCGMRADNAAIRRYRMTPEEIVDAARLAQARHFGTVVIQAGESAANIPAPWMAEIIRTIKRETNQHITLSLSERTIADYTLWREAGADRYLLRFETSDPAMFRRIHPGATPNQHDRLNHLHLLKDLGYQVGSGFMVGLPGQSYQQLAQDLQTLAELRLDMIGLGPYIPHPATPLAQEPNLPEGEQVPADVDTTLRVLALARIMTPEANIPSTTALSTIDPVNGRKRGLQAGCNVFMPNLTPRCYRESYQIYPDKICVKVPEQDDLDHLLADFKAIGRFQQEG